MRRLGEFLGIIFKWPASLAVIIPTFLGMSSYFSKRYLISSLVVAGIFLITLALRSMYVGYQYYISGIVPIAIKAVKKDTRLDGEAIYVILEKRPWIDTGQVFLMEILHDHRAEPLGYVVVESRLHGSDQRVAVLVDTLHDGAVDVILDDRMRRSLQAQPILREEVYRLPRRLPHG